MIVIKIVRHNIGFMWLLWRATSEVMFGDEVHTPRPLQYMHPSCENGGAFSDLIAQPMDSGLLYYNT